MEVVYDIYLGNKAKWYIKKKNQWSTQQPGKNNFCVAFHFSGAFSGAYSCVLLPSSFVLGDQTQPVSKTGRDCYLPALRSLGRERQ